MRPFYEKLSKIANHFQVAQYATLFKTCGGLIRVTQENTEVKKV
jgi:hypothetical protein